MKKGLKTLFLTLVICLLSAVSVQAASGVKISKANFPDKTIRKIAKSYDKNGNGYLSKKEIKKIKTIRISGHQAVTSFKGIEYFTSLEIFGYNMLDIWPEDEDPYDKQLDLTKNKQLKKVTVTDRITSIDVSGLKKLEDLDYGGLDLEKDREPSERALKKVNVWGCTGLKILSIWDSGIQKLDVSTCTSLRVLSCQDSCLKSLNVEKLTRLKEVHVNDNLSLKKLDLRKNKNLCYLYMENTAVSELQLHPKAPLRILDISYTDIHKLDVTSFSKLYGLYCNGLGLTKLNVKKNTELKGLYCEDNQLKTLNLTALKKLKYLECQTNYIKELDLSQTKIKEEYLKCDDEVKVIWK